MSIICIICRESLTSNPIPGKEADWDGHRKSTLNAKVVVPKCGHAQHEYCLKKWIKRRDGCPYCNKRVSGPGGDLRRIYPLGDEDLEDVVGPSPIQMELEKLRRQNDEKDQELAECRRVLNEVQTSANAIKVDYARLESNFNSWILNISEYFTMLNPFEGKEEEKTNLDIKTQ